MKSVGASLLRKASSVRFRMSSRFALTLRRSLAVSISAFVAIAARFFPGGFRLACSKSSRHNLRRELRIAKDPSDAVGDVLRISWIKHQLRVCDDLGQRSLGRSNHRGTAHHGCERRQSKPLREGWLDEHTGGFVEGHEVVVRNVPELKRDCQAANQVCPIAFLIFARKGDAWSPAGDEAPTSFLRSSGSLVKASTTAVTFFNQPIQTADIKDELWSLENEAFVSAPARNIFRKSADIPAEIFTLALFPDICSASVLEKSEMQRLRSKSLSERQATIIVGLHFGSRQILVPRSEQGLRRKRSKRPELREPILG